MSFRIGNGFDVHKIGPGNGITLGGIFIDCGFCLIGHSDGDVLIHALCDAIYGSLAEGDIGIHFPDTNIENKGRNSMEFLNHARSLMEKNGYKISNIDLTVICEKPKISPIRKSILDSLAGFLSINRDQIGLKGTTTEKLGFTGRGEGIAAMASIIIEKTKKEMA